MSKLRRAGVLSLLLGFLWSPAVDSAIQSIDGWVFYPTPIWTNVAASTPALNNDLIDAASEKSGATYQASKACTVDRIHWRTGAVTTGCTVDVRLETVGTDGQPSGTLFCANSNASQVVADTDDTTTFTTSLTAGCTVAVGDRLALVVSNPAASFCTGNIISSTDDRAFRGVSMSHQYTTAWASNGAAEIPWMTPGCSDGTYFPVFSAPVTYGSNTFNSGSATDERGNIFQLDATVRVIGWWALADYFADGDFTVKLYDSDGSTALLTDTVDIDARQDCGDKVCFGLFTSSTTLSVDTNYRIAIAPTSANNVQLHTFTVDVATVAVMDALDGGQNIHETTRADAGAWSQTTNNRSQLGLIIDGFDDATGAAAGGAGGWGF